MTVQIHPHGISRAPELCFLDGLTLTRGRIHELCGNARIFLALVIARACTGPIFWIRSGRASDQLCAPGLVRYIDPSRLYLAQTASHKDTLWSAEEILHSGQSPLVIAELDTPLALTPVRRLHLAAQSGAEGRRTSAPVGLILCPGTGGAQGVDSRWQMQARNGNERGSSWNLTRLRARAAPPKSWIVRENGGQAYLVKDTAGSVTAK